MHIIMDFIKLGTIVPLYSVNTYSMPKLFVTSNFRC